MINLKMKCKRAISTILVLSMFASMLSGCSNQETYNADELPAIDTEAIANEIIKDLEPDGPVAVPLSANVSTEWFVYQQLFNEYALMYDVFNAVVRLSDGTEVMGFAYTDYALYYEATDGNSGFFPAGFVADFGGEIPESEIEDGLIIENLDYIDEQYGFVLAYETNPFMEHCVRNGEYLRYGISENGSIEYQAQPYERGSCDESLGALYSYDENRYVFDPNMGEYIPLTGTSLYEPLDFEAIEAELNRILEEQDKNFVEQEIITNVYFAQEAVISYWLSMQEETFLGYRVSELVECAQGLDPMELIRVSPDGLIVIDVENSPPEGKEAVAKWTIAMGCAVAVIGSTALNIFVPAARPISGAITGAAIEVFMQVVINNQAPSEVQWSKVAVAAVSGALMAWLCPLGASKAAGAAATAFKSEVLGKLCGYGVLTLSNSIVSGATSFAIAKIDGEEDGLNAFLCGAAMGAACTVGASLLSELVSAVGPKLTQLVSQTKPGRWMNKVAGKTALFISKHQVHLKNEALEQILSPKSIHEATKQALREVNGQVGARGGKYKDLPKDSTTQNHETPSFSSTGDDKRGNAPAVKMSAEDHRRTASYGNSNEARNYRAEQAKLISEGKYHDAIQMDIDDLTSKFGTKYTEAINQMLEYATQIGWW